MKRGMSLCGMDPGRAAAAAFRLAQDKELQERMKEAQRREVNPFAADEICDRVAAGI